MDIQNKRSKRPRSEGEEYYDTYTVNEDVTLEVTTGEGVTLKFELPANETVFRVKQEVEQEQGIRPREHTPIRVWRCGRGRAWELCEALQSSAGKGSNG
jgi:hypothetical protein